MQEIKRKNEIEINKSAVVNNGVAVFDLGTVFKTIYKDSAEFSTHNSKFVYSFSDCEINGTIMTVRIQKLGTSVGPVQLYSPANNIKIYLTIKAI